MPRPVDYDSALVELCVPAHLLVLAAEELARHGTELRPDMVHRLNVAAARPLARLDELSIARVAKKIDAAARALLQLLALEDPHDTLYVCAAFVLTLVDEGLYPDPRNQAVLLSLLLLEEVKDDTPDPDGQGLVWRPREAAWRQRAKHLVMRANLLGLYLQSSAFSLLHSGSPVQ